jgi:hypothetical protein
MGALNSWLIWGGLAAAGVTVPIVIHLLHRKHRRQTNWAAMELLRRAIVIRSGQVKLEDYLILALRCLAMFLIAAALLRLTRNSDVADWAGTQRVGMVVAIDASFSMNHGEFSRFEKAIQKAKAILKTAGQGEPVSVVLMSSRPEILLRRTGYDPDVFDGLLEKQKAASPYRFSLERNLTQLEELVTELKTPGRECYLITDGQELDWGELSDKAIETLGNLTDIASVFVVPVEADGEDNISLSQLTYSSGSLRQSGVARFLANVRNEGRSPTDGGNVEFFVGTNMIRRLKVGDLKPGETRGVEFTTRLENSGDFKLRARLSKDELLDDNQRHAVVSVRESVSILCVDDEPLSDGSAARTGVYYAIRALRGLGRGTGGPLEIHHVQAADLSLENLPDYNVILMANVTDVAPEMVKRIDRFVRGGGGLLMFLGNQVDAELYNQRFGTGQHGLLPGELGKTLAVAENEKQWTLAPANSQHSLSEIVGRLPKGMTDSTRFAKVVQVKPVPGSQTILSITGQDAPLLLSRDVGAGIVLLVTTSADRTWNELPVHPLYTMLLQQAITNMTSRPDSRQMFVGEPATLPVRGRQAGDVAKMVNPDEQTVDLKVTQVGEQLVCVIETDTVGVYQIVHDKKELAVSVAANVDSAESNVRVIDPQALAGTLEPLGVRVVSQTDELATAIKASRQGRELTNILLVIGIVVFILQSVLAKHFTNRMSHPDTDVSASLQMSRVAAARRS